MYGFRAKTITEAGASPRLHITAEEGTGLTGLQEPDYNKFAEQLAKSIAMAQAHECAQPEPIRQKSYLTSL